MLFTTDHANRQRQSKSGILLYTPSLKVESGRSSKGGNGGYNKFACNFEILIWGSEHLIFLFELISKVH